MGQLVLLGLSLSILVAAFLLYQAGGRFAIQKQRATVKELDRELATLHADFISHVRADAGRAGVAAKKQKAETAVAHAGDPGEFFARQAQTDPEAARANVLAYFRAQDGNGGK